jgi:hypothetical protein
MLQVAQWHSPAYIKEKARQGKLTPAPAPLVIKVPMASAKARATGADQASADPAVAQAAILWRQLLAQVAEPANAVAQAATRYAK